MTRAKFLILAISFTLIGIISFGQTDTSQANKNLNSPQIELNPAPPVKVVSDRYGFLTDLEFTLSISVLLFGALVLILEVYLIKIKQVAHDNITKIILVTLIVIGTLFLITAGYNNNQIAPATGLLGTIAGYLLGKSYSVDKNPSDEK